MVRPRGYGRTTSVRNSLCSQSLLVRHKGAMCSSLAMSLVALCSVVAAASVESDLFHLVGTLSHRDEYDSTGLPQLVAANSHGVVYESGQETVEGLSTTPNILEEEQVSRECGTEAPEDNIRDPVEFHLTSGRPTLDPPVASSWEPTTSASGTEHPSVYNVNNTTYQRLHWKESEGSADDAPLSTGSDQLQGKSAGRSWNGRDGPTYQGALDETESQPYVEKPENLKDTVLSRTPVYPSALLGAQRDQFPDRVLEFPPVPEGETYRVHELGLSEGVFLFGYLGEFLSWIQPHDFPVELLRDALWNRLSVAALITQVEIGFVVCLCLGVFLALAGPSFVLMHACCRLLRFAPVAAEDDFASSSAASGNCRRRSLVFLMQVLLLLMVPGIVAMLVTNEQLSRAVQRTPDVVHTALGDVANFVHNSNLQLRFVVTKSLDQAVEAASADLDDVDNLLGRPIQRELEDETGVGSALNALVDVTAAAQAVSGKVDALHQLCGETRGLALVAQERLQDLAHQVGMFRRQCPPKDRPLCDTVDAAGLDVLMQLDSLLNDARLSALRRLAEGNLSVVTQQARGQFQFIPTHVEKETRDARNGVRRQLLRQRSLLDDALWSLDALSRDLSARVDDARDQALQIVGGAADLEQWRYLAGVGASVAVLLVWSLLLAGLTCGCCGARDKARPTLLASVGLLCLLSLGLWALALAALLVGGHAQVLVCRPLYDEPGYAALTRLVDRPGVLFQRGGGFFSNLLHGNDSLDVPLKDVLRSCQQNRPTYSSFRLSQVFDADSASDHRGWEGLHRQLRGLQVNLTDLQLLTPELQAQLQGLLTAAMANLTTHRAQVTTKDLLSFSDQLESVANQITDLATASRLETLASRTRRLLTSHIEPLKERKEDMVYQLTALEVQLVPLQRQVNQSLSHLKTIQYFINNQGSNISNKKSHEYVARITGYVQRYREHVLDATGNHVAPCRPMWDAFHATRLLLCRHVMDPLNGFWFGAVWCLVLLLAATPLALKVASCYGGRRQSGLLPRAGSESPSGTLNLQEHSAVWTTPGAPEPDNW